MADDRLPKRAAELRDEGRRRRGRPRLRWEGEEEGWKKKKTKQDKTKTLIDKNTYELHSFQLPHIVKQKIHAKIKIIKQLNKNIL